MKIVNKNIVNMKEMLDYYGDDLYSIICDEYYVYKQEKFNDCGIVFKINNSIIILKPSKCNKFQDKCVDIIIFSYKNYYGCSKYFPSYWYRAIDLIDDNRNYDHKDFNGWFTDGCEDNGLHETFKYYCKEYYNLVKNVKVYDYYNDENHKKFINKQAFVFTIKKFFDKYKLPNTKNSLDISGLLLSFINFLNNNNMLLDWTNYYIINYEQPLIILKNNASNYTIIKIQDFDETDDKIIDLKKNNNLLAHTIAYYNNKKATISKTMDFEILINEILKNDIYAEPLLNNLTMV